MLIFALFRMGRHHGIQLVSKSADCHCEECVCIDVQHWSVLLTNWTFSFSRELDEDCE